MPLLSLIRRFAVSLPLYGLMPLSLMSAGATATGPAPLGGGGPATRRCGRCLRPLPGDVDADPVVIPEFLVVPRLSGGVASQDRPRRYFSWVQRAHLAPRLCRPEASTTSGSEEPRTRAESGWHTATAPTSHPRSSPSHGGGVEAARWICVDCPVRSQCLEYALANRIGDGMWGGTSERERRAMLSEHDRSYLRPPLTVRTRVAARRL
jgi:Transcription factor WhiB